MSGLRMSRVMKDLKEFGTSNLESGIVLTDYDEEASRYFKISIAGPVDSPYETGSFDVNFKLPANFPFHAPKVKFETPVWHPNIGATGNVCVDILSKWKSGTRLLQLAEVMQGLLRNPNPASPLNADASIELDENPRQFNRSASMWTSIFAGGSRPQPEDLLFKVNQVRSALGCNQELAVRKLSRAGWVVEDAISSRRHVD